jgi:hypothetical protein
MSLMGLLLGLIDILITVLILLLIGAVVIWVAGALGWPIPQNIQKIYMAIVALIALVALISLILGSPRFHIVAEIAPLAVAST